MSKHPTSLPIAAPLRKSLRVRKQTVRELSSTELSSIAGGFAQKTSQSQICNKTTTGI